VPCKSIRAFAGRQLRGAQIYELIRKIHVRLQPVEVFVVGGAVYNVQLRGTLRVSDRPGDLHGPR